MGGEYMQVSHPPSIPVTAVQEKAEIVSPMMHVIIPAGGPQCIYGPPLRNHEQGGMKEKRSQGVGP